MEKDYSILCVDDNSDNLELLKLFFEAEGCTVVCCTTHIECFEHLKISEFSAIVLDVLMPEKDGLEICSEIRLTNQDIPIVFYSADATYKSRQAGLEAGANVYLLKPNDIGNLVPTVMELIAQSLKNSG